MRVIHFEKKKAGLDKKETNMKGKVNNNTILPYFLKFIINMSDNP